MEEIEVKCCYECPFYNYGDESLNHTCMVDGMYLGTWGQVDKWKFKRVHNDCPLKKGGIIVKLSNNNRRKT